MNIQFGGKFALSYEAYSKATRQDPYGPRQQEGLVGPIYERLDGLRQTGELPETADMHSFNKKNFYYCVPDEADAMVRGLMGERGLSDDSYEYRPNTAEENDYLLKNAETCPCPESLKHAFIG